MKKIISILICIVAVLSPLTVSAKSYNFGGYYCDAKQPNGDGTFTLTCHIIATTDFEINHIEGSLILKNVTLKSIKTSNDWVSNNGLSSSVDFSAKTTHKGTFNVADLTFVGNLSDTECEASFNPKLAELVIPKEEKHVCVMLDDKYYGKNGEIINEEKYYEDCCNYACTVVDNKYYFNSTGKSVSYDAMLEDCKTVNPQTGIDYGLMMLPFGILAMFIISKFAKKNTKIYKI